MKTAVGIVGIVLLLLAVPAVHAEVQEDQTEMSQIDLSQFIYSYGTIIKVSQTQITLQEYDYDSDIEKEVTYQINNETKMEGFASIADFAAEDVVEIYYLEKDGQRIAKIVNRELVEDDIESDGADT